MENSLVWAAGVIADFGYLGLALTLVVNCLGIPIASEATLPLTGIAIHAGKLNASVVLFAAVTGQMVGFIIAYLVARHAGLGLIERYGHFLFISHKRILTGQHLFKKHGPIMILIGLCIPGVHGYMGYSAGLAKMPRRAFLAVALAGTSIWTMALLSLGYLFGDHLAQIMDVGNRAGLAIGIVLAVAALAIWYSRLRRQKSAPTRTPRTRSTSRAHVRPAHKLP